MGIIDFLQANWAVIVQAPWAFVTTSALFLSAGFVVGRFFLSEKVENLKSRLEARDEKIADYQRKLAIASDSAKLPMISAPATIATPVIENKSKEPTRSLGDRVFVPQELTPERIFGFYHDNTHLIADELTRQYIGNWISVTGPVKTVGPWTGSFSQISIGRVKRKGDAEWLDHCFFILYFRKEKMLDRIRILKIGDTLAVLGQIERIDGNALVLDCCEFK